MSTHHQQPAPRSRRERPAKPALTRAGIIDAAVRILREEGLGKVTMRRIADVLDTGPASLYVYVCNTADLHAQVLDALLAPVVEAFPVAGPWRDQLQVVLLQYMLALYAYPEIARITLTTHLSGPHYLAIVERLLALLHTGGLSDRQAAWAVDLLLLLATANAAEHSPRQASAQGADEDAALVEAVNTIDATTFPQIARIGGELVSGNGRERFQWSIDIVLNGILASTGTSEAQA